MHTALKWNLPVLPDLDLIDMGFDVLITYLWKCSDIAARGVYWQNTFTARFVQGPSSRPLRVVGNVKPMSGFKVVAMNII